MTNRMIESDPDFYFPSSSSSSIPVTTHQKKLRKKRIKSLNMESSLIIKPKTYSKKPDPSAPKITEPCTECGKKFWSWKALFGHMRCHPERQWRGINPPPKFQKPNSQIQQKAVTIMSPEDHEVAACLLLLANSQVIETGSGGSCSNFKVENDIINCRFECSSCKKVFGSHQALGGHRASHKNVKGCFAITRTSNEDEENFNSNLGILGHKCSICLRVFSSGQALGGHKRCHWEKLEEEEEQIAGSGYGLDLNLPAPVEVEEESNSSLSCLDLRLGL